MRFREELGANLVTLLERHGVFRLEFMANQVLCDEQVVHASSSRDDNFAMPFFRDGLYALTFRPGFEASEIESLVDLLLRVTSRAANSVEDLVTLLWDADLPHLGVSYVSSETDTEMGDAGDLPLEDAFTSKGRLMPWPERETASESGEVGAGGMFGSAGAASSGAAGAAASEGQASGLTALFRNEDWPAGAPGGNLEQGFAQLDATSALDVDAFMWRMRAERAEPVVAATLALVRNALQADPTEEDREDLVELIERVLRDAIAAASWSEAGDAVTCLADVTAGYWDATFLVHELAQPESPVTAALVRRLDEEPIGETNAFAAFARGLGASSIEWLMAIVALAHQQRTRRVLLRALIEMCEGNPERLAPWLTDPRWYVVRNAVHVIGASGGRVPTGLFQPLLAHPEVRVRQEIVAALAHATPEGAQPLLLQLVRDTDASVRGPALYRLGGRRNATVSSALLELVVEPGFRKRPEDEFRSVLLAVGGCSGDEALPILEAQLLESGGFLGSAAAYQQAVARCIARIGTYGAQTLLERGARSRQASVREACKLVLKGTAHA